MPDMFSRELSKMALSDAQKSVLLKIYQEALQRRSQVSIADNSSETQSSELPANGDLEFSHGLNPTNAQVPNDSKVLCKEHPEDLFSHTIIDTELSKLDEEEIQIFQWIYLRIAYNKKLKYFSGSPKFAMRSLDFSDPNVENIIVGECQSGKSAEIAWVAFCTYFCLGCLPIIFIRNSGGKTQGTGDMIQAIERMNEHVCEVLSDGINKPELFLNQTLREKAKRCLHNKRFYLQYLTDEAKVEADGQVFRSGKVLLTLMNSTHLRKMMEPFSKSRKMWFLATLINREGCKWRVAYDGSDEQELRGIYDLQTKTGQRFSTEEWDGLEGGMTLRARKSADLRVQEGLLKSIQRYGEKQGKRRVIFIMDEGDLSVGNPSRNKNVAEKLMFQNKEKGDLNETHRGAREYVFGSVFVTATPQALFICTWNMGARKPNDGTADPVYIHEEESEVEGSSSGVESVGSYKSSRLRPHVVYADRPLNYIAYPTKGELTQDNPHQVVREVLEERFQKVKNKLQVCKQVLDAEQREGSWQEMVKGVISERRQIEIWPGIGLRYNPATKSPQIYMNKKNKNAEQEKHIKFINNIYHDARNVQRNESVWEQDGEGISHMLSNMIQGDEAFRHALIITDKTKSIRKQRSLADDILTRFSGATDLAVATYNCEDGVAVKFAQRMLSDKPNLLQDVCQEMEKQIFGKTIGRHRSDSSVVSLQGTTVAIKDQPIAVMYETLKSLQCTRIVVITGEIGGRGVSYHDKEHKRILTDMYTAQDVFADATVTSHGEMLVQLLGRLNTIATFSTGEHPQPVPKVRLWATLSVHNLHETVLEEIRKMCEAVRIERDYTKALKSLDVLTTGVTTEGKPIHLRMSRPRFSQNQEREMRGPTLRPADITPKRSRGICTDRATEPLFPKTSLCKCVERRPHGVALMESEGEAERAVGNTRQRGRLGFAWNPAGEEEWNADEYSLLEVEIPIELLDDSVASRFIAERSGLVFDTSRRQPWLFKTLGAARDFVGSSAAGRREANLFQALYWAKPAVEEHEEEGVSNRTESDSDLDSEPGPQQTRRSKRQRRGLTIGGVPEGQGYSPVTLDEA